MAKFQWNGNGETANTAPSLLTSEWHGSVNDWEILTDAEAESDTKICNVNTNNNNRRSLKLTAAGNIATSVRVDIRGRFYRNTGNGSASQHFFHLFISGDDASETAYYGQVTSGGAVRLARYNNAAFATIQDSSSLTTNAAQWFRFRALFTPGSPDNNIKIRLWEDAAAEPATWHVDADNSDITTAGGLGFGNFSADIGSKVDWISFGTAGDDADDLKPGTGPDVSPGGIQRPGRQYSPVAASRLGGVLQ